jgi:hypothetical protein
MFGETEAAVRLPGLLFGFLGAVTTGLLARQWFGRTVGWAAGIFYATTILPTAMAQAASHDVALIPLINLAVLLLWKAARLCDISQRAAQVRDDMPGGQTFRSVPKDCQTQGRQECLSPCDGKPRVTASNRRLFVFCILAAGLFLGLSILTKGMMGIVVVGLVCAGTVFFDEPIGFDRKRAMGFVLRMSMAVGVAILVAAPWYFAMERQNPNFLRYYFFDRHLRAFATGSQPHSDQPWWYYLPILLGGGLPWIGYLRWGEGRGGRDARCLATASTPGSKKRRLGEEETGRFADPAFSPTQESESPSLPVSQSPPSVSPPSVSLLWLWLLGWTLFLTLARSKLATYLWPAFPPLAILAAIAWTNWLEDSSDEKTQQAFVRMFRRSSWFGPIVLPSALLVVQWACGVRFAWLTWTAAGVVAAASLAPLWPLKNGRRVGVLAAAVLSIAAQFTVVMIFVVPTVAENYTARSLAAYYNQQGHLPRRLLVAEERIGSLVFYLAPSLRAGLTEDRIDAFSADYPPKLQVGDVIALPKQRIKQVGEYLDLSGVPCQSVGRYRLYPITQETIEKNKGAKR